MPVRNTAPKKRLNMRIPLDLLTWAQEYVFRNGTTLTDDYIRHLEAMRKKDKQTQEWCSLVVDPEAK